MISREEYLKALDIVEEYNKQLKVSNYMPNWRDFYHRRKRLGLSMQDVTNCTGISKATISRLEQGKEVYYGNVKSINDFYSTNEER
jgi:predicted transcriptional regulator